MAQRNNPFKTRGGGFNDMATAKRPRLESAQSSAGGGGAFTGSSAPGPFGANGLGGPVVGGMAVFPDSVAIKSSDELKRVYDIEDLSNGNHE